MKKCTKCGIEYPATTDYFYARNNRPSGLVSHCRKCSVIKSSAWNKAHPDKRKASKKRCYWKDPKADNNRSKKWREANKERHHENTRRWIAENKDRHSKKTSEWTKNNIEQSRGYWRKYAAKRATNPTWRISNSISRQIAKSIIDGKAGCHWETITGFTLLEFITHMESKFTKGMGWDNYGTWHVDHKRPVSSFTFSTKDDRAFKECWSLENLQPLWAKDNLCKGAKML